MADAASILRIARRRAGLSQRELASRADTAQSVVARIELGQTSPTWDTLARLVAAAGFDLDLDITIAPVAGSHMLADVPRILGLSPENRLRELANLDRLVQGARRVS